MGELDFDKLLTNSQKKQAYQKARAWAKDILEEEISELMSELAQKWVTKHREELEKVFHDEISKRLPNAIRGKVDEFFRGW